MAKNWCKKVNKKVDKKWEEEKKTFEYLHLIEWAKALMLIENHINERESGKTVS